MSAVISVLNFLKDLVESTVTAKEPSFKEVNFPADHPMAGKAVAGAWVREIGHEHEVKWTYHPYTAAKLPWEPRQAIAEVEANHAFANVKDMAEWIKCSSLRCEPVDGMVAFLEEPDNIGQGATLTTMLQEQCPELGTISCEFAHHPQHVRWQAKMGAGVEVDMPWYGLAEFLADNREAVIEDVFVKLMLSMKMAKQVSYDADLDNGIGMAVKVEWSKAERGVGQLDIPRNFHADIPFFVGAWDPGKEPKFRARFSVRLLPARGRSEDSGPWVRIRWENYSDLWLMANDALFQAVRDIMPCNVFRGVGRVVHRVLP